MNKEMKLEEVILKKKNIIKKYKTITKEHIKDTNSRSYVYFTCEKCGKETSRRTDRIKDMIFLCNSCKKINSYLDKYGVDNPAKSKDVQNKIEKTSTERYGTKRPSQSKKIKTKYHDFFFDKLKVFSNDLIEPLFIKSEYDGSKKKEYKFRCKKCNNEFTSRMENGQIPRCLKCNPHMQGVSNAEKEVSDFIKEIYKGKVIENTREIISPLELDIYLPELNLAIEFDGLYWHSIEKKEKEYHLNKSNLAEQKGIQVLHVFEDEWRDKQNIVKNIIRFKLGLIKSIYARKTNFKEIGSKEAKTFLDKIHIDGFSGAKYHYGLFFENELVAVMSIGKPRYNKNYDWEIVRVGYKYRIIGGLSKLLKNFRKSHVGSIITYANRRYFDGHGYQAVGFKFINNSEQNYYYTDFIDRFTRVRFQKHKLKNILEEYDEKITEKENMLKNGYSIIYDCGNKVFELV